MRASLERRRSSSAWAAVLVTLALLCALPAGPSRAAVVRGGDVLVMGLETLDPGSPHRLLIVHPSDVSWGLVDPVPPLTGARDMVVRADGEVLVLDDAAGVVSLDPRDGRWRTLVSAASFAGIMPTTMTLTPSGDLLAAGLAGVVRVAGTTGAPVVVSGVSFGTIPRGIATDGGSNVWVCDTGLVNIDIASGTATRLALSTTSNRFPMPGGLACLRWRGDGFLYVVNVHGTGSALDFSSSGIYRVDPLAGSASYLAYAFTESFMFDSSGEVWVSQPYLIHGTPQGPVGYVFGPGVDQVFPVRGALAIVPPGITTPARKSSWAAIKRLYR